MKKVLMFVMLLGVMPAWADIILTAYNNTFYAEVDDPSLAGPGDLVGISDIYYYYDPVNKTLKVTQTEWLGDGTGMPPYEYPAPYDSTFNYTDVTFDNMCDVVGYCDDVFKSKIQEMRAEYESYLNVAANTKAIETEVTERKAADEQLTKDINAGDEMTLVKAKAYADEQSSLALKSANNYTDKKVNALEKELSAGIASTAAMSSVEVSNVSKGEMSVGGGYGYYNSQSAVAFGAAVGVSDNWSVNAAVGLADSNVSCRAGTNYKFKLF